MLNRKLLFACLLLAASCTEKKNTPDQTTKVDEVAIDTVAVLNDPKKNLNVPIQNFDEIDTSGILIFPLSIGESNSRSKISSSKEYDGSSYWNIIFHNSKTSEYYLLTENKILIRNYQLQSGDYEMVTPDPSYHHIYYTVITDDYNKDKELTNDDPSYLYISDRDGKNFRQLSPTGYDLVNWQYVKSSDKIILNAKKDSDRDNAFGGSDEIAAFEVNVESGKSKAIFSQEFKDKLILLFERDWKRK